MAQEFTRRFGSAPELWARAPGRVDLMGSHTDYNEGYVLTMAIDRNAWLAFRPRDDQRADRVRAQDASVMKLPEGLDNLRDPASTEYPDNQPDYAANDTRSLKPEYLVVEGSCTHLGCAPLEDFEVRPAEGWGGGFFCPCHGSKFDLAGRVYKGVPAPSNLRVPPHRFVRDDLILIGQDTGAA